jgi:transposase
MNAIFYVLRGGITWRLLPHDFPPKSTVYRWFALWRDTGLFERLTGKKVKGRKRQVIVDTDGRALILVLQSANVQDRDAALLVLHLSRCSFPFITRAFADMGYAGDGSANATSITVEIDRKPADRVGFAVHPRRWVVERFSAGSVEIDGCGETRRPRSLAPEPSSMPRP